MGNVYRAIWRIYLLMLGYKLRVRAVVILDGIDTLIFFSFSLFCMFCMFCMRINCSSVNYFLFWPKKINVN